MAVIKRPYKGYTIIAKEDSYNILFAEYETIYKTFGLSMIDCLINAEIYIDKKLVPNFIFYLNKAGKEQLQKFVDSCENLTRKQARVLFFSLQADAERIQRYAGVLEPVIVKVVREASKKEADEEITFSPDEFSHDSIAVEAAMRDTRLGKLGVLKIDNEFHVRHGDYGIAKDWFGVFFPTRWGKCIGVFQTLDEAVKYGEQCHEIMRMDK